MKITRRCTYCNKIADEKSHILFGENRIISLSCGHTYAETVAVVKSDLMQSYRSLDDYPLYDYQIDGITRAAQEDFNFLYADEMGVGKAIQCIVPMKLFPERLLPALIVCKSSLKAQIAHQVYRWTDLFAQTIDGTSDFILPKADVTIVSYDLIPRILPRLEKIGFKYIILDECQSIKNWDAKRTKAIIQLCRNIPHRTLNSGTPIKNNMVEYFPSLHIIRPEIFHNREGFIREYVDTYFNGYVHKFGGLSRYSADKFRELTKNFIIRRTRAEVLPDLPQVTRNYTYCTMSDGKIAEAYDRELQKFEEAYLTEKGPKYGAGSQTGESLMRLKHLVGLAKIPHILDNVEEFLTSTDRKIAIFVHHKDVGWLLNEKISHLHKEMGILPPLQLISDMDSDTRAATLLNLKEKDHRVIIASTLAGGVGLDMQFMADGVMAERQWTPADEEQPECRFIRPGQESDKVLMGYPTMLGTVEELLAEIVERKRGISKNVLDGQEYDWKTSSIMAEVGEQLFKRGMKRWALTN